MVAITVILAAVIGTFVIGLGDDIGNTAPNANLALVENVDGDDQFDLRHRNGDTLDTSELTVINNGTSLSDATFSANSLSAGETSLVELGEQAENDGDNEIAIRHDPSGTILLEGVVEINQSS